MNIWYLSAHDQPRGRSARTYDFSKQLVNRGHQVTMFTNSYDHWTHEDYLSPQEKWRIEEIDGIQVVWMKTIKYTGNGLGRGLNMISNAYRAIQVARTLSDKPDVVIGPSVPIGTGWAALMIAKMKGAAFVFEVRDVWPIALVDDGGLSKSNPIYYAFRYIEKFLYRNSQRISSTLPFIYQHVLDSGCNPEKIAWIPNGVDFQRFSGFDRYEGGKNFPLVVMSVGGFGAAHDPITIVRAAAILQKVGNNKLHFVLVGNGPKRIECQLEATLNNLTNVEFRDSVEKFEVPRLQMEADIFIASVIDSPIYRFGINLNKMYDYFASARPVIFSGNSRNDPIADSRAGFSIAPENADAMVDALEKLSEMSGPERVEMGARGRRYVEKEFGMGKLAERMELLLLQAIKDKGLANAT